MTGVTIRTDIDDALFDQAMKRALGKMADLRPFYVNVGEHMLNSVQDRFDSQTAPNGSRWTPLAPATVRSRLRQFGNAEMTILRARGRMAGSINYEASSGDVRIGTPMVQGAIQHFGGQAGRGGSVTIPARPYLGFSPQDEIEIRDMAEDYLRS